MRHFLIAIAQAIGAVFGLSIVGYADVFDAVHPTDRVLIVETLRDGIQRFEKRSERLKDFRINLVFSPQDLGGVYATDGTRCRFETDFYSGNEKIRCVRILANDLLIKYDPPSITIDDLKDRNERWLNITSEFSLYENPIAFNTGIQMNAKEISAFLLGILMGTENVSDIDELLLSKKLSITMQIKGTIRDFVVIDSVSRPQYKHQFSLDLAKGGVLTRWSETSTGGNNDYEVARELVYDELSKGVWMLKNGIYSYKSKSGKSPDAQKSVRVLSNEIGSVQFADNYFSIDSLTLPLGTHVEDHRVEPIALFTYGKSEIDPSVLDQAAKQLSSRRRIHSTKSVWGYQSVVLFGIVSLFLLMVIFRLRRPTEC